MANLKEVRERITSVGTTQQITKAMKLVAASKLKRAQDRITQMRPYSDKLYGILEHIMANVDTDSLNLDLGAEREERDTVIVLFTSDKGLCGAFNANLIKRAKALLDGAYAQAVSERRVKLLCIGKRGADYFKNHPVEVDASSVDLFNHLSFDDAADVADMLMKGFLNTRFDKVICIYSKFVNAATQDFTVEQFLPVQGMEPDEDDEVDSLAADYIFEPEKATLIRELVPKILRTRFYRYLLDNNASEHGSRMVAMEQATENANTLLGELKLEYNRERQAAITTEILEIVGGAAALEEG